MSSPDYSSLTRLVQDMTRAIGDLEILCRDALEQNESLEGELDDLQGLAEERDYLEGQVDDLEDQLAEAKNRIKELESE